MDNKKQKLIETAYRLVRTRGFDSFSYNDLSVEVGITKASVHYYFPNKEELGLALCDLIMQRLDFLKMSIDCLSGAQEKLECYARTIIEQRESDQICPISSLQAEYYVIPDTMKQKLKEITLKELELVAGILQAGFEEKVFYFEGDAMAQAALLVTSIKSSILYSRVLEKDLVNEVIEQFIRQIQAQHQEKQS